MSGTDGAHVRLGLDDVLAATRRPVAPVPGQSSLDDLPPGPLRYGSLFSGYGGLDMGVQSVLGGEIAWHCQYDPEDKFQYAARILAHHWPKVPNLGDISAVDWKRVLDELGPIDVLLGGFPCTDLSLAGQQLGLMAGTRSGLWSYMLRAAEILRPRLVVIENVRGILSTKASSGVELEACCVEHAGGEPVLRALGAVLGDLASIGFDAEWEGVQASDVGAPHERFREFILAWPADTDGPGLEGSGVRGAVAERFAAVADATRVGERESSTRSQSVAGSRHAWSVAGGRGAFAAADSDSSERVQDERHAPGRQLDVQWGDYEGAVRRWETITGRLHPWPTDDRGRLAPEFSEWMMGLAAGHVCAVPGAPGMSATALRNARLKALGNGVVPLQSAFALRLLLDRVRHEAPIRRLLVRAAARQYAA